MTYHDLCYWLSGLINGKKTLDERDIDAIEEALNHARAASSPGGRIGDSVSARTALALAHLQELLSPGKSGECEDAGQLCDLLAAANDELRRLVAALEADK